MAAYFRNSSKNIGGPFRPAPSSRSGIVGDDGIRVILRWGRQSNADIYSQNPSQGDFMITLSLAF